MLETQAAAQAVADEKPRPLLVTAFVTVTGADEEVFEAISQDLLEQIDKVAGEVEAGYTGVKVVGVSATK